MTRAKLTTEEIDYITEQITEAKGNLVEGVKLEKVFELFKNLVLHCDKNVFDVKALELKNDLEKFIIGQINRLIGIREKFRE